MTLEESSLWSHLLFRKPSYSIPAIPVSLLFLEHARSTLTAGPLHFLFPLPGCIFPQTIYVICFFSACGLQLKCHLIRDAFSEYLIQMANLSHPRIPPLLCFVFFSGSCYPLTFDILIPQIVFYPLCRLELQCSIELAVVVETVYICAVQYGHHRPMWFLSTRNVAGEIEELYFELGLISIHWKVSSYMWPVAAVLNSTSLDYLFHENGGVSRRAIVKQS